MPEPPGHREGLPRSLASRTAGWPTHSWGHSESPDGSSPLGLPLDLEAKGGSALPRIPTQASTSPHSPRPSWEMGLFRLHVCLPDRGPQWAARAWASVAPLLYREAVTAGHSALSNKNRWR